MGTGKDAPLDSGGPGSPDPQSPTNALLPEGPSPLAGNPKPNKNNDKNNTLPPGLMNVPAREEKI